MLDVHLQRRQQIAHQVQALIAVRGPRTAGQKLALSNLLREADELESDIENEHQKRQSQAFNNWLIAGDNCSADDKRLLRERRDMVEAGLATGQATGAGVLVPVGFEHAVASAMKDYSPLLAICSLADAPNGRPHPFPLDADASVTGELLGEGQQASLADVNAPAQVILNSYKLSSKIIVVSRELLNDQEVDFANYLPRQLGIRLARIMSQLCTIGSGSNQPTGFMNSSSIVNAGTAVGAFTNDGASGSNSLGTADLALLESAVDVAYRKNASWMVHPSTLQAMRAQVDKQGRWLWPGLHHSHDGVNRIFGYPLYTNPFVDQLQTQSSSPQLTRKPIVFADFSRYKIRRAPLAVWRMDERFAEFDKVAFLAMQRIDGNWVDSGACAAYLQTTY